MITFEHVTKRYGERLALDDVNWRLSEGECATVLGHSAAGKTTLLRLITQETLPTSGTVKVGTFRSGKLSRAQRALLRRTIGVIYEDFRLLPDRTAFENVALAVRIAGHFADAEVIPRVMYALEEVGLKDKQTALPSELSFGEKQRCAIARAIVNRPALILADEPTGALEPRSAGEVLALLRRVHAEGAALLVGTTRPEVAEAVGGNRFVLAEGRLSPAAAPGAAAPHAPSPFAHPAAGTPPAGPLGGA